jgi:hypothetical protein
MKQRWAGKTSPPLVPPYGVLQNDYRITFVFGLQLMIDKRFDSVDKADIDALVDNKQSERRTLEL